VPVFPLVNNNIIIINIIIFIIINIFNNIIKINLWRSELNSKIERGYTHKLLGNKNLV